MEANLDKVTGANSVLGTELFPELRSNLVAALAHLQCNNFTRHVRNTKWNANVKDGSKYAAKSDRSGKERHSNSNEAAIVRTISREL